MMWFYFIAVCLFFGIEVFSDFSTDLNELVQKYNCTPNCTFNHSEINSETMKFYPPKCHDICGILTINENTDLSSDELKTLLKKTETLRGGLIIENTMFRDLSFLPSAEHGLQFYCITFGTRISNNTRLVNADTLFNIYSWSNPFDECKFQVLNNPKLEISDLCESENYERLQKMEVYNNKKDCGCLGGEISLGNLKTFKKCIGLFNGMKISNMSFNEDLNSLSKIKVIKGNVEIAFTDFTDLSFFKSLEQVKGQAFLKRDTLTLNIHDNPNMKRLGLQSLVYWRHLIVDVESGWTNMNLQNLHPDFCLTYIEAKVLLYVRFKNLEAKFCENQNISNIAEMEESKLCHFISMEELDYNCTIIFGNLLIHSGDEGYVKKLEKLRELFGSLVIENTELEDIKFLEFFNNIYFLDDTLPVIRISNNQKLKRVSFFFMSVFAKGKKDVVIENNAPNLFRVARHCLAFQSKIKANVTYNGRNCKAIDEINHSSISFEMVLIIIPCIFSIRFF